MKIIYETVEGKSVSCANTVQYYYCAFGILKTFKIDYYI